MTTILLVEPNATFLAAGADVLTRGGYEVVSASTADDALAIVPRFDPHLILLDGQLAYGELLERLAKTSVRPLSVIFTFLQGRGAQLMNMFEASAACASLEVIGFVEKPFAADVLITTVDEGVRAAQDAAELEVQLDEKSPFETTQRISMAYAGAPREVREVRDVLEARELREDETQISDVTGSLYRALGIEMPMVESRTVEPELPDRVLASVRTLPTDESRARRLAERIVAMMPERYPLHPAQMCAISSACEEALREESTRPNASESPPAATGSLRGVPVFQVLQLAENLAGRVICRLEHEGATVEVFIHDHHVVLARERDLPGDHRAHVEPSDRPTLLIAQTEQIVYEVLSWTDGRFSLIAGATFPREAERSGVAIPLQGLLLEGLSRLDEWRRVAGVLPQ